MKHALHFPRFGKTLLAAALVAMAGTGCATDQSLLGKLGNVFGSPAQAKSAAAGKAIEGDITSTKALEFLYGNQAKASPVFDAKYTEQGKDKYILLAEEDGGLLLSAAVFVKEGGQWTLEAENRNIDYDLADGKANFGCFLRHDEKPVLARVGPDKHGILIHAGGGGHGNSVCPTVLLPDGGSIRSVLIGIFEMQISSGKAWGEDDARASFDEQSAGEYYDAVVRYIDIDNNSREASRRFQFRNGVYHKVATPKAGKKAGKKKRK